MNHDIDGALDEIAVNQILEDYEKNPTNKVVRKALSRTLLTDAIYDSSAAISTQPNFSINIETMPVTNQKQSGRCWIFAGLNILREIVAKKAGIKELELSQNYISLYDKIEKANFALESIISLCQYSPNERVFQHILNNPVSDGGQWDMFVNLIRKYGVMPKSAFPETQQSNATAASDFLVNAAIRKFAADAHRLANENKQDQIRMIKDDVMEKIYHMFLSCFGVPPKTFDFEYTDTKGKYHVEENLTAKSFFEKYVGDTIFQYQSIINSPTSDKPFNRNYTIDYLGNVVEGKPINHLNLTMNRMKDLIIKQLSDGLPVWFGSDVSFYRDRSSYAWDSKAFDYQSAFGLNIEFDKAEMLDFRHSAMNHAMVITGVDIKDGKPTRWKIENSWGSDIGLKGYYVMSSEWFDVFVYQAVILRKYLTKTEISAANKAPIHLNPWDPMGTLAD